MSLSSTIRSKGRITLDTKQDRIGVKEGPTAVLARFARDARFGDLPVRTVREAHRTFLNWLGCAIGASRHAALENALAAIRPIQGPPQAAILGRRQRTD